MSNAGPKRIITAMGGTTFSPEVMQQLKESFRNGMNNSEACLDANISERIFYNVIGVNSKLKEYFGLLQKNISKIAKQNIVKQIKDKKDIELSKWWSERKNKEEFSVRTETDITTKGESINYDENQSNQIAERIINRRKASDRAGSKESLDRLQHPDQ